MEKLGHLGTKDTFAENFLSFLKDAQWNEEYRGKSEITICVY